MLSDSTSPLPAFPLDADHSDWHAVEPHHAFGQPARRLCLYRDLDSRHCVLLGIVQTTSTRSL